MTQKKFSDFLEEEKKVHYTIYLNKDIADLIEEKAEEIKISKNKLIEKYLEEITNYQHPYLTIKNHLKIIRNILISMIDDDEIENGAIKERLKNSDIANMISDEERRILCQENLKIISRKNKYQTMLFSIDIIEKNINFIL